MTAVRLGLCSVRPAAASFWAGSAGAGAGTAGDGAGLVVCGCSAEGSTNRSRSNGWLVGLPQGEHEVQQLSRTVSQGHIAAFAAGTLSRIQRLDGRVEADGRLGGHPQQTADEVIAFVTHVATADEQRISLLVDAGRILLGEHAEVIDQRLGRLEAVDGNDLGDQGRGGPSADAGDRQQLVMATCRQRVESLLQQFSQFLFRTSALTDFVDQMAHELFCEQASERPRAGACRWRAYGHH